MGDAGGENWCVLWTIVLEVQRPLNDREIMISYRNCADFKLCIGLDKRVGVTRLTFIDFFTGFICVPVPEHVA